MRRLSNAQWNVAEMVVSAAVLFLLYRLNTRMLGVEAIGVWSLVAATPSLGRAFDLGAAGGVTRFVALQRGGPGVGRSARTYVETALLLNAVLYGAICVVMYFPADLVLTRLLHGEQRAQAHFLLPLSLATFGVSGLSAVVASTLVGLSRSDVKSGIAILASALLLPLAFWGLRRFGLPGVGLALLMQSIVQAVFGWIAVNRLLGATPGQSRRLELPVLKELLGFGAKFQAINLLGFLQEPAVRYVITLVGGIAMVGYYEMAWRCTWQVRSIVSAPAQNLTPLYVAVSETSAEVRALYDRWVAGLFVAAAVAYAGLCLSSPLIGLFWLSHISLLFVEFVGICSLGALVNIVSMPAFFLGIGGGRMIGNVAGAAVTTLLSPALAWLCGRLWGNVGLAAGSMIGVAFGAVVIMLINARLFGIPVLPPARALPGLVRDIVRDARGARR